VQIFWRKISRKTKFFTNFRQKDGILRCNHVILQLRTVLNDKYETLLYRTTAASSTLSYDSTGEGHACNKEP
jgi:hypothetical protein